MGLRSWILESEKQERSLREVMAQEYQSLTGWLYRFDLTEDEIKEPLPGLYQDIQDAIQRLDEAFVTEDMPAFQDALNNIKELYTDALFRCGRRIAVKVYSELLGCYLWVVANNEDIHLLRSQGVTEAIYTHHEITELKKLSKGDLKEIHKVKQVFPESIIRGENNNAND
ncbi:MAG: hypothetical protein AB1393_08970 [Candidatus Edwardsbacteria bacterium]